MRSNYSAAQTPSQDNSVRNYSAGVAAGGVASAQSAGTGCNSPEFQTNATIQTATLEALQNAFPGRPCEFNPGSFDYAGITYVSGPSNKVWGGTSLDLGTVGTAPVGSGPAPGFYTTNTRLRVAFDGAGTNTAKYYGCQQRFNNGSARNCTLISTGTFNITTLGDARVMSFNNLPAATQPLTYTRVFVERGGKVFFGYKDKGGLFNTSRLNLVGGNALLTQLGLPAQDPSTPLALTAGSYAGTWDTTDPAGPAGNGNTIVINNNGTATCTERLPPNTAFACSLTVNNPATGAFTFVGLNPVNPTGTFNFLTGLGSGTYSDNSVNPAVIKPFTIARR